MARTSHDAMQDIAIATGRKPQTTIKVVANSAHRHGQPVIATAPAA